MPFHFLLKPRFLSSALIASSLLLGGCNDSPNAGDTAASEKSAPLPLSEASLAEQATGFSVGSPVNARTFYVFFDAQCPHCGDLWNAAKPLKPQARFVWIPVGIINASSTAQGASILAAADPVAEMDKHEASLLARQGGISARQGIDAQKAFVGKNTKLMESFGFASIPAIIGTHAQTGAMVRQEGAMPTAALAKVLGLKVP